jgi:hypothetical protein
VIHARGAKPKGGKPTVNAQLFQALARLVMAFGIVAMAGVGHPVVLILVVYAVWVLREHANPTWGLKSPV